MTAPYRKPGECLPDRPLPPAVVLPRPPGKRMWINMLQGRGRDLRYRPSRMPQVLAIVAGVLVLAAIVAFAMTADIKDLEPGGDCSCSCSPKPCSCSCDRRRSLFED